MSITIDNSTNIMHWEHDDVSYEYKIDSTGRAFAYMSGDYIFIGNYSVPPRKSIENPQC